MNAREGALGGAAGVRGVAAGVVFVLAGGRLRHMGCAGEGFLGYSAGEIFWQDLFELVRDAAGGWLPVEATAINVLEAPGDAGLIAVNLRDLSGARRRVAPLPEPSAS